MLGFHGVFIILAFLTAVIGGQVMILDALGVYIILAFLTAVIGGQVPTLEMGAWIDLAMMLTWERQIFYIGILFRGTLVM